MSHIPPWYTNHCNTKKSVIKTLKLCSPFDASLPYILYNKIYIHHNNMYVVKFGLKAKEVTRHTKPLRSDARDLKGYLRKAKVHIKYLYLNAIRLVKNIQVLI